MATRYGSAASVLVRTGITPPDLGMDNDPALETFIDGVLDEVTDLMDRRMHKSYLAEVTVPAGLDGIANDACADSLRVMVATRQTPVVHINDFVIRSVQTQVFSKDILLRLQEYSAGGGVGSYELSSADLAPLPNVWTLADLEAE